MVCLLRCDSLSLSAYHCKALSDFFAVTGDFQSSLFHFFKVMARLHGRAECRPLVVFPICVREYEDNVNETKIVFSKLVDYLIGLPDSAELRRSFLEKLKDTTASSTTPAWCISICICRTSCSDDSPRRRSS